VSTSLMGGRRSVERKRQAGGEKKKKEENCRPHSTREERETSCTIFTAARRPKEKTGKRGERKLSSRMPKGGRREKSIPFRLTLRTKHMGNQGRKKRKGRKKCQFSKLQKKRGERKSKEAPTRRHKKEKESNFQLKLRARPPKRNYGFTGGTRPKGKKKEKKGGKGRFPHGVGNNLAKKPEERGEKRDSSMIDK